MYEITKLIASSLLFYRESFREIQRKTERKVSYITLLRYSVNEQQHGKKFQLVFLFFSFYLLFFAKQLSFFSSKSYSILDLDLVYIKES